MRRTARTNKSPKTARVIKSAGIKILAVGKLTKKLTVVANAFSATAKAGIESAGGTCEVVAAKVVAAKAAKS